MDYTIRDGVSCGSTIGQYDVDKIVDNSILFKSNGGDDELSSHFRVGFFHRALAGIEQFFTQRHQGYKYLIYHRTSSRTEACLQELFSRLLLYGMQYRNPVSELLFEMGYLSRHEARGFLVFPADDRFLETLDDSNLRTILIQISKMKDSVAPGGSSAEKNAMERIALLTDVVLRRKFQHIYDPFKSSSLRHKIVELSKGRYDPATLDKVIKHFVKDKTLQNEQFMTLENAIDDEFCGSVTCVTARQVPKVYDDEKARKKGEEVYLLHGGFDESGAIAKQSVVSKSHMLKTMPGLYHGEYRVNCYFIGREIKSNKDVTDRIDTVFNEFLNCAIERIALVSKKVP